MTSRPLLGRCYPDCRGSVSAAMLADEVIADLMEACPPENPSEGYLRMKAKIEAGQAERRREICRSCTRRSS